MAQSRIARLMLVLIIGAGAVLRIDGLVFGMPGVLSRPDELTLARIAINAAHGQLRPPFLNYPTFFPYIVGAVCRTLGGAWLDVWLPGPILIARLLSAIAGALTIPAVWRLARRFDDAKAFPLAACSGSIAYAVAFLAVRDAHFGVTDTSMVALTMWSLAVLLQRQPDELSLARTAGSGMLAGLAMSTKYPAAFVILPACVWMSTSRDGAGRRLRRWLAAAAAAFVAATPYAVLDWRSLVRDVGYEARHLRGGHATLAIATGWLYHLRVTLWFGAGPTMLVLAVVGAVIALRRQRPAAIALASLPVVYFLVVGSGRTVFARYMLPELPFLAIACGIAVGAIHRQWQSRSRVAGFVTVALLAAVCLPNLVEDVRFDRTLAMTDSRILAENWIAAHVNASARVYVNGDQDFGRIDLVRPTTPAFVRQVLTAGDDPRDADWIVVQDSPLTLYSHVEPRLGAALASFEPRWAIAAYNPRLVHVFDQQDGFFLPLDGMAGISRPGPNVTIYQRRVSASRSPR